MSALVESGKDKRSFYTVKNNKGFSFMEILGVIAVMLILIMVAGGRLSASMARVKLANTQEALIDMRTTVMQLYFGAFDYSGLSTEIAKQAGIIPEKLIRGNNVRNPWNGEVILAEAADQSFSITLTNVPKSECVQMAIFQADVWDVTVGSTVIEGSVATATTACASSSNTITYVTR